jgi:hypothetical protein
VCTRWVPKELTEEYKHNHNRVDISSRLLQWYRNEGNNFLNHIITGNETLIHHYEPQSKGQSMQWMLQSSPAAKKFKTQPTDRKLMLTVFWNSQGAILEHYQERGTTVTSARYSNMLWNEPRPATCTKWQGRLLEGVLFLHTNAWPHTAAHTKETLQELKFEVLEHPAYSLDLATLDFHLFGPLKETLRGCRFVDDDEVKEAVHDWLHTQPKQFFTDGMRKLVDCWTKCAEKQGDYVEKRYTCNLPYWINCKSKK